MRSELAHGTTSRVIQRSALYRGEQKVQQRSFGPTACVAGLVREKGAVAAVPGLDQPDAVVGEELAAGLGSHTDEGIVESVQDQRGHRNVLHPVGTGNTAVVIVRARETAVSRDDPLVELPHGVNLVQALCRVESRVEFRLVAKALEQVAEKPALVKAVLGFVQCGGGSKQIHERRDADDGLEIGRRRAVQLAGQLENQIAPME